MSARKAPGQRRPFTVTLVRLTSDEDTRAIVRGTWTAPAQPDPQEVMTAILNACTAWRDTTANGAAAWAASAEDFNIGDLSNHLYDRDLRACLAYHGITRFRIDLACEERPTHEWHYDSVLMDPQ